MKTPKHRFFAPPDNCTPEHIILPPEEGRHAVKVMRLGAGDEISVVDGVGGTFRVKLETVTAKKVVGRILERTKDEGEAAVSIHACMALLKNASRWETFLEKAVELGCSRITPLSTSRTLKNRFNRRRADAILIAALKQSGRSRLPILDDPMSMTSTLEVTNEADLSLIAHETQVDAQPLTDMLGNEATSVAVLIGPEGGFSEEEVHLAIENGCQTIWLGKRRLRAETAAIALLGVVSQLLDAERKS